MTHFQHPMNGYTVRAVGGLWFLWALLFGFFYFAYKGIWKHAIIGFVLAICTGGISWLIYPFFAKGIVLKHYRESGGIEVAPESRGSSQAAAEPPSMVPGLVVTALLIGGIFGATRYQSDGLSGSSGEAAEGQWGAQVVTAALPDQMAPADRWRARRDTLSCASIRSAQRIAVSDALRKAPVARDPKRDASIADCRPVKRGDGVSMVMERTASDGISLVRIGNDTTSFMPTADIAPPAKAKGRPRP